MTWTEKEPILSRLGHRNFESEEHYENWFAEQDNPVQNRIRRAVRDAEEYSFSWNTRYFQTNKNYNDAFTEGYQKKILFTAKP